MKRLRNLSLFSRLPQYPGFTLPELLVIVVIIGVIAAVGISGFFFLVRRARVQSVALEVAGWLEQVRNAAADEVTANRVAGGCRVAFDNGDRFAGGQIATVDQDCTFPEAILRVPLSVQQDFVNLEPVGSPVTFTPRGLWVDSANVPGTNFQLTISLNGDLPVRCIRLSPALGAVEIGRPPNSASDTCTIWQGL
ncbi:GspH/FimT family protein [Cyanobium sp. CH-040]|uniref:GspH/FimT family protein n=1 Tax=Cyanobium sp. CH-040 TaxID=2823708 RepID=UPI0020CC786A|nr:GspH/FimT family protein [Cyanobium sp. CH-040]MCP9926336.1 prepilin-type N-terminal cleavage/methylation domain-containing protein [Cyanobium sp. CH-040]